MLCYGGPLSYVLGEADRALAELLRVTKGGGRVLLSVMSLLGTARAFLEQLSGVVDEFGWQRAVVDVFETGDLDGELNKGHVLRMYRWSASSSCSDDTPVASSPHQPRTSSPRATMHGTSAPRDRDPSVSRTGSPRRWHAHRRCSRANLSTHASLRRWVATSSSDIPAYSGKREAQSFLIQEGPRRADCWRTRDAARETFPPSSRHWTQ